MLEIISAVVVAVGIGFAVSDLNQDAVTDTEVGCVENCLDEMPACYDVDGDGWIDPACECEAFY